MMNRQPRVLPVGRKNHWNYFCDWMNYYIDGKDTLVVIAKTTWKPHLTDGIVVGRVPGVDDGGVHEPDVPLRHLPQLVELGGGAPLQHAHHVPKVIRRVRIFCSTATTKPFDPSAFPGFFSTHTAKNIQFMYSQKRNCSLQQKRQTDRGNI